MVKKWNSLPVFILVSVFFIAHHLMARPQRNRIQPGSVESVYVELKSCNIEIALPSDYSVLEERDRWMAIVRRYNSNPASLLIISCQENTMRTTSVHSLLTFKEFHGRPAYETDLFQLEKDIPAVSFKGEVQFQNRVVMVPIVSLDTRDLNYHFFLFALKKDFEPTTDELTRIVSTIKFRGPVEPPITEEDLNLRIYVFIFFLIILIVMGVYAIYRVKVGREKNN